MGKRKPKSRWVKVRLRKDAPVLSVHLRESRVTVRRDRAVLALRSEVERYAEEFGIVEDAQIQEVKGGSS